jgi:5-oxoprolinase (ATP-hydrolysing) subunit A
VTNERRIDLNCDLGEGCPHDAELMPLITSANISCGAHGGDAGTLAAALALAQRHGVQAGAHPGFFDREHFGRRELSRSQEEIYHDCIYQVGGLWGLARSAGLELRYLKPHGALYNLACRDEAYARSIARVARFFQLPVLGLPGSVLAKVVEAEAGVRFVAEGFADRRYQPDGSLVPRGTPDAFVENPAEAVRQVEWLIRDKGVETVCVHGDNPQALDFVRELRHSLVEAGFCIEAWLTPDS